MPTGYGRDKGDRRIVRAVKAHGGRIPTGGADTPKGWPTLSPGTEGALDTDGDSIPDWFEIANGSDPDLADADEYDYDGGGAYQQPYMNVEVHENVTAGDPHVLVYVQVN